MGFINVILSVKYQIIHAQGGLCYFLTRVEQYRKSIINLKHILNHFDRADKQGQLIARYNNFCVRKLYFYLKEMYIPFTTKTVTF